MIASPEYRRDVLVPASQESIFTVERLERIAGLYGWPSLDQLREITTFSSAANVTLTTAAMVVLQRMPSAPERGSGVAETRVARAPQVPGTASEET